MIIDRERGFVAVPWGIEDVKRVIARRNIRFKKGMFLSNEDCFQVLTKAVSNHDADEGITIDIIEFWITALFRTRISNFGGR